MLLSVLIFSVMITSLFKKIIAKLRCVYFKKKVSDASNVRCFSLEFSDTFGNGVVK